jgi:hypothetical protein
MGPRISEPSRVIPLDLDRGDEYRLVVLVDERTVVMGVHALARDATDSSSSGNLIFIVIVIVIVIVMCDSDVCDVMCAIDDVDDG